jgi:hypothetical protein
MRIHTKKQRAVDLLPLTILANGLADGKNMTLIKSLIKCRTAMPGGGKGNPCSGTEGSVTSV